MRSYRVRFMPWALTLLALIMLPNLAWFAVPPETDALKQTAELPWLDALQMGFQAIMIGCLCMLENTKAKPLRLCSPLIVVAVICCAAYYVFWIMYFSGMVNALVLLALCLFPSMAFLLYGADRRNVPGIVAGVGFSVCHMAMTLMRL